MSCFLTLEQVHSCLYLLVPSCLALQQSSSVANCFHPELFDQSLNKFQLTQAQKASQPILLGNCQQTHTNARPKQTCSWCQETNLDLLKVLLAVPSPNGGQERLLLHWSNQNGHLVSCLEHCREGVQRGLSLRDVLVPELARMALWLYLQSHQMLSEGCHLPVPSFSSFWAGYLVASEEPCVSHPQSHFAGLWLWE